MSSRSERTALKPSIPPTKSSLATEVTGVPREKQSELASNIGKTSMEWVSQIGQMRQFEAEFARRLAHCSTPSEAVALCSEWMAHRLDSAVAMQHRLLSLWLDAMTAATCQKVEAKMVQRGNGDVRTADGRPSGT
jgi:hypothetical protein